MKVAEDRIHSKMYANTWMYDNTIEKVYHVILTIKYLPKGGKFNVTTCVNAFNKNEAAQKAAKAIEIRCEDRIVFANPVATNIV